MENLPHILVHLRDKAAVTRVAEMLIENDQQAKALRGDVIQAATVQQDVVFILHKDATQHLLRLRSSRIVEVTT